MDWDRIEGSWKQFRGKAKSQWGALTDDELTRIAGKQDQLIGKLQERYGYSRDRARGEVERWANQLNGFGRPMPQRQCVGVIAGGRQPQFCNSQITRRASSGNSGCGSRGWLRARRPMEILSFDTSDLTQGETQ